MKKKLIPVLILLIAAAAIVVFVIINRPKALSDDAVGNTGGNLLNGGLFREDGDRIFFSNLNDEGNLYVMKNDCTDFKKLSDDKASYINTSGDYVVYARKNYEKKDNKGGFSVFMNSGIFRTGKSSNAVKMLYGEDVLMMVLAGNYVYYTGTAEGVNGNCLKRIKINKSDETSLSDENIMPMSVQDKTLYYTGVAKDHNIYAMNLDTKSVKTIYKGNCAFPVVQDSYIYFLDLNNNYALTRINLDGSAPVTLVKKRLSTYNISPSAKYLYYQVDDTKNNRICRYNTETKKEETILKGNYNSIHVTSNYVFFREFGTNTIYVMPGGESGELGIFNPPVKK